MSKRDDIPKPSGSLTAEQRQAMARIEMRRAERLKTEQGETSSDESVEAESLSLLDEGPESNQLQLTSLPASDDADSIEWSVDQPDAIQALPTDGAEPLENAASNIDGSTLDLAAPELSGTEQDEPAEHALQLDPPAGLSPNETMTEAGINADLMLPEASLTSADEDVTQREATGSDDGEMLPTVDAVARDASDYQALRASKSPVKRLIDDLSSRMFRNNSGIAATAAVVSVAATLLIWSVFFRLDILDEVVALEMVELDLEDKHATLALELSALNSDSMESEIQEQSTRIFPGFPALANWIERVSERAEGMNMNVRYRVEPASYAPVDEVLEVPVIIELEVASETDDELFSRGMGLIASLLQDHWHLDIASTSAEGDGKGMRTLEMEARVWVFDVEEFVSSSLIADRSGAGESGSTGMEFGGDAEIIQ